MADDTRILRSMRQMEWEKVKAHIRSMGCTHWHDDDTSMNQFRKFHTLSQQFIKAVEGDGLHE